MRLDGGLDVGLLADLVLKGFQGLGMGRLVLGHDHLWNPETKDFHMHFVFLVGRHGFYLQVLI